MARKFRLMVIGEQLFMTMHKSLRKFTCGAVAGLLLILVSGNVLHAQTGENKKYPTLLWEITGHGLKKPSYLFGTMHVSSKMAFHLSDSFYLAIKNSDVVALELDPQLWQDQMYRYQSMQSNLRRFTQGSPNNYLNEKSFQLEKYDDRLRAALSEEPTLINGLLYRTIQPRADFEEDTYLDLYIYQTGKKMGKQATGVENYFETERLILEATQDMMRDRKKRVSVNADGDSFYDVERKTQDAYRKGDLDMLDSLEKVMQPSGAYLEKFLYLRNEIQARSIDSILQVHSLFVGVGAAHLPGKRGVIELLRLKGYTLRPMVMMDEDAALREEIDHVKVPVSFSIFVSEDEHFSVRLPGKLHKRLDSRAGDSWQYADMGNGAYYMITRVNTHGHMLGQNEQTVLRKVDSLLYENIPGKILRKTTITRNGWTGLDITNRTRRGDLQRYNIFVTPYEVLIFKMSGTGSYVEDKEADQFFGSIELKAYQSKSWVLFSPARGGFEVRMPQSPSERLDQSGFDGIRRWEYEADDPSNGDAYLVWKRSIQNYRFLEEDSFDLGLMEESFRLSEEVDRELSRRFGRTDGRTSLETQFSMKDGSYLRARFIVAGPHYYVLAARSRNRNKPFNEFFSSFRLVPAKYRHFSEYTDSVLHIQAVSPVIPDIDIVVRNILEKSSSEDLQGAGGESSYWPKSKSAFFQDDSTGEAVYLSVQTYPAYYFPKDSASFWSEEVNEEKIAAEFIIKRKEQFSIAQAVCGVKYTLADTNSSRIIQTWIFLKDNRLYRLMCLRDSLGPPDEFTDRFFASIRTLGTQGAMPVFTNKLDLFFKDFYSRDSLTASRAREAIPTIHFGEGGMERLVEAIMSLPYNQHDYFAVKTKLINELGNISDSGIVKQVVLHLKDIYELAKDTSTIQNAVLKALARNKSREAYAQLRTLLVQDPPIFNSASEYGYLFQDLGDSLALAATLFPDLLDLASVDDYKTNIHALLTILVDSGYLKAKDYESYFGKLFFEAKIQLKKQQGLDEKRLQQNNENGEEGNADESGPRNADGEEYNPLDDYAILLLPFREGNKNVSSFFDRLLDSKDPSLRLNTASLLVRNHQAVSDSVFLSLAANDLYRFTLYKKLESVDRADRFPAKYMSPLQIARSALQHDHGSVPFAGLRYIDKYWVQYKQNKGFVYFFLYKTHPEDEWMIGLSGLQPPDPAISSANNELVRLTGKKVKPEESLSEQLHIQLRRLLYSKHRSAASFYLDSDYYVGRSDDEE